MPHRLTSELDQIPGIGEKTRTKLLKHFGSSEQVRAASEDALTVQVGRAAAKRIKLFYANDSSLVQISPAK